MTMKVPTAGELKLLAYMLGKTSPADLTLCLYVNNYTPVDASVLGDFTEMSTHGYASKTLTMASWGAPSTVSSKASSSYAQQTWSFTAAAVVTVYGWFLKDSANVVVAAEKFTTGQAVEFLGDIIRVTPVMTLNSEA